ncbi:hypothetical protein X975_05771, partial [Stegodyphus mimosarum]
MHSPMQKQKYISSPTNVFRKPSLTETCFHAPDLAERTRRPKPAITSGISDILGGTSSTLAYLMNVANLGFEPSTTPFTIRGSLVPKDDTAFAISARYLLFEKVNEMRIQC